MGVYPAITPDVRVVEIEGRPGNVAVVVKVPESIEAPHAIENSTRVYVRVASTTSPYDLADIDRIEYLLKRREQPEKRREDLIGQVAARSTAADKTPRIRFIVAPLYPRGLLLPHDMLEERAEELQMTPGMIYLRKYRLVHNAVRSVADDYCFEVDVHGIVFFEAQAETQGYAGQQQNQLPFIHLIQLLRLPTRVLNHALMLLHGRTTNVLIRYELFGWDGIGFLPQNYSSYPDPAGVAEAFNCINPHVSVSIHTMLETLRDRRIGVLAEIMKQVLWAFNYSYPDVQNEVGRTLRGAQLI